ncbi:nucleoside ABC transporter ATP-binding protein [Longilinea arvoryzae]|uniref:Nucleoside ABC transporter ATP-binding protein n=1 Tax=Longilinea arvoryzae TaxID=360412 RepID=A0A0S7BKK1_9CHLR|nr:ABC transporter ATP-binding protein [Longilinea arvoryzae]GAP14186.1 nucleoside ABC transporter ATP-binding protein [Longilinea arvoryzae]
MDSGSGKQEIVNVVTMRGIVKRFPGVLANDHVDFTLKKGEIHALLGENGAGKSTLMNILAGLYRPDAGIVNINNKPVTFSNPRQAISAGIGMVHQHFMLVPSQTVTENILLGLEKPSFLLHLKEYDRVISDFGKQFGLEVDPTAKIWQLSVGEQQRVELLKMLYRGAEVLIMDEPTAVLAPTEIDGLFAIMRKMIDQGKSIIFISHKLNEVMAISDEVTVLRHGRVTAAGVATKTTTIPELARLMVGREVIFDLQRKPQKPGKVVVDVKDVCALNDKGLPALQGASLHVCAGEIVGLAGVAGNGQRELADVLTGLRKCSKGSICIQDEDVTNKDAGAGIRHNVSHIPEDRTHVGTAPDLSVTDNMIMKKYHQKPIGNGWFLSMQAAEKYTRELKDAYDIIAPSINTPVRMLSGGNLQRVILAREISALPTFMVAVQPTRGLDVGAIEGVQRLLLTQREAGSAVLLISEELDELLALSDRIYVIYEGKIMGEVLDGDIEKIGLMMTGTPCETAEKEQLPNV